MLSRFRYRLAFALLRVVEFVSSFLATFAFYMLPPKDRKQLKRAIERGSRRR